MGRVSDFYLLLPSVEKKEWKLILKGAETSTIEKIYINGNYYLPSTEVLFSIEPRLLFSRTLLVSILWKGMGHLDGAEFL